MMLEDYIVTEDTSIIDAMKKIDANASGNIFICKDGILLAVVTDGDIRRSIMRDIDRQMPVSQIANYNPITLDSHSSRYANEVMCREIITALPIIDENHRIVDIKFLLKNPHLTEKSLDVPVVIMAGGKGSRLKPYTDILPKPLIPIGDKTITEHIMEHFEQYGCNQFYMIINYKKHFIKSYFADSEDAKNIIFIEEEHYLGTGGGLALLEGSIKETFFLTNCDILLEADYNSIFQQHKKKQNMITIVCAKKKIKIPYGTVEITEEGLVKRFTEKPSFDFNTSTGFYIIEPEFLNKIKRNIELPITDIIQECLKTGERVGTYLIEEDAWMDMGQLEELEKMKDRMNL